MDGPELMETNLDLPVATDSSVKTMPENKATQREAES